VTREGESLLESDSFGLCHLTTHFRQSVVPPTFIVLVRIWTFVEFDDEALLQETADRRVQSSGIQFQTSASACGDISHDRVSVAITVGQRYEDMKGR
jgi:hypothetical protein